MAKTLQKTLLISICFILFTTYSFAQLINWTNDNISYDPAYAKSVYYSLKNGTVRSETNANYDLAFSFSIADSAAVWSNPFQNTVYNIHKPFSEWANITLADTANAKILYNNDQGWYQGAYNDFPSANPFDFGWGIYDNVTHNILGDSIFIVKSGNTYYKLYLELLNPITATWTFRVGDFTGNTNTYTLAKSTQYADRNFAYWNLAAAADTNREPANTDWDILFTRYHTNAPGSGSQPFNRVTGLLTNKGVKAVKASAIEVDSAYVHSDNYTSAWGASISEIGYDWKVFTGTSYQILDSISYFIMDKNSAIYQLQLTDFEGSATGYTEFRKRPVYPVAVHDVNAPISQYDIFPNPAQQQVNILLNAKEVKNMTIQMIDMQGRLVLRKNQQTEVGLNAYSILADQIPNGMYQLMLTIENYTITKSIVIQK
ncbi:MAG: T9SS type A sorting domain-containing protein [Chitinophagaceae bacterium]